MTEAAWQRYIVGGRGYGDAVGASGITNVIPDVATGRVAEPEPSQLSRMPARLLMCTPSRLAAFDCPRRYRFTYLDRPTPPRGRAWAHNAVGSAVHLALSQWWQLDVAQRTAQAAAVLVEGNWQTDGFRDATQSEQWRTVAVQWVRRYVEHQADARSEPAGVERTVAVKIAGLAISGRVDRIDDRGTEVVVVDYKTGRRELTADDARGSQALALYVLATRSTLRRDCRRVELHHLPTGTISAYEHTEESLDRHLARAQATADDIVTATDTLASGAAPDEVFPPVPRPSCSWCDFRSHCPEGRAASVEIDSWAGLAETS